MKKYDLLRCVDSIIRILEIQDDKILMIDCIKQIMPVWVEPVSLGYCSECTVADLSEVTGVNIVDADTLDADQRKVMYGTLYDDRTDSSFHIR